MNQIRRWAVVATTLWVLSLAGCGRNDNGGSGESGDGYYQGPVRSNPDVGDEGKERS